MNFLPQVNLHPKGVVSKWEIASAPVMFWTQLVGLVEAILGTSFICLRILSLDIALVLVMLWTLLVGSIETGVGASYIAPAVVDLVELAETYNGGYCGIDPWHSC